MNDASPAVATPVEPPKPGRDVAVPIRTDTAPSPHAHPAPHVPVAQAPRDPRATHKINDEAAIHTAVTPEKSHNTAGQSSASTAPRPTSATPMPVAAITIAVLLMLALSGLAVLVYMQS